MANDPNPYRRRRPGVVWWLWALAAAVAVIVFALLVKSFTDSGDSGKTSSVPRGASTGEIGSAPGGTQAGGAGSLKAGSRDLLALARGGGSLAPAAGAGRVRALGIRVQRRIDDSGFFAGSSQATSVFVEVEHKGLASIDFAAGDHVSFTGTLERNLEAGAYGLRANAGAAQFRAQRYHVKVRASQLTVG